jgi:hypothetical protein
MQVRDGVDAVFVDLMLVWGEYYSQEPACQNRSLAFELPFTLCFDNTVKASPNDSNKSTTPTNFFFFLFFLLLLKKNKLFHLLIGGNQ